MILIHSKGNCMIVPVVFLSVKKTIGTLYNGNFYTFKTFVMKFKKILADMYNITFKIACFPIKYIHY